MNNEIILPGNSKDFKILRATYHEPEVDIDYDSCKLFKPRKYSSKDVLILQGLVSRLSGINVDDLQLIKCQDSDSSLIKTIITPAKPIIIGDITDGTKQRIIWNTQYLLSPNTSWKALDPSMIEAAREVILGGLDAVAENPGVEILLPIQLNIDLGLCYLRQQETEIPFISRVWVPKTKRGLLKYAPVKILMKPERSVNWHVHSAAIKER